MKSRLPINIVEISIEVAGSNPGLVDFAQLLARFVKRAGDTPIRSTLNEHMSSKIHENV